LIPPLRAFIKDGKICLAHRRQKKKSMTSDEMSVGMKPCQKYPIISIERWSCLKTTFEGFASLTSKLGALIAIVAMI